MDNCTAWAAARGFRVKKQARGGPEWTKLSFYCEFGRKKAKSVKNTKLIECPFGINLNFHEEKNGRCEYVKLTTLKTSHHDHPFEHCNERVILKTSDLKTEHKKFVLRYCSYLVPTFEIRRLFLKEFGLTRIQSNVWRYLLKQCRDALHGKPHEEAHNMFEHLEAERDRGLIHAHSIHRVVVCMCSSVTVSVGEGGCGL